MLHLPAGTKSSCSLVGIYRQEVTLVSRLRERSRQPSVVAVKLLCVYEALLSHPSLAAMDLRHHLHCFV